jgi:hypothetical protein
MLERGLVSSEDHANELITAFLQYFSLHELVGERTMAIPGGLLDETYHLFILNHTGAYHDFCMHFFGREIQHVYKAHCDTCQQNGGICNRSCAAPIHEYLGLYGEALSPILQEWMRKKRWYESLPNDRQAHYADLEKARNLLEEMQMLQMRLTPLLKKLEML